MKTNVLTKLLLILGVSFSFIACEQNVKLEGDSKDVSQEFNIQGQVSSIFSNLFISSAYAADLKAAPKEASKVDETAAKISRTFLGANVFENLRVKSFDDLTSQTFEGLKSIKEAIAGLDIYNNLGSLDKNSFKYGMVIIAGFNADKKIVSIIITPTDKEGNYSAHDKYQKDVAFYNISSAHVNSADSKLTIRSANSEPRGEILKVDMLSTVAFYTNISKIADTRTDAYDTIRSIEKSQISLSAQSLKNDRFDTLAAHLMEFGAKNKLDDKIGSLTSIQYSLVQGILADVLAQDSAVALDILSLENPGKYDEADYRTLADYLKLSYAKIPSLADAPIEKRR